MVAAISLSSHGRPPAQRGDGIPPNPAFSRQAREVDERAVGVAEEPAVVESRVAAVCVREHALIQP